MPWQYHLSSTTPSQRRCVSSSAESKQCQSMCRSLCKAELGMRLWSLSPSLSSPSFIAQASRWGRCFQGFSLGWILHEFCFCWSGMQRIVSSHEDILIGQWIFSFSLHRSASVLPACVAPLIFYSSRKLFEMLSPSGQEELEQPKSNIVIVIPKTLGSVNGIHPEWWL